MSVPEKYFTEYCQHPPWKEVSFIRSTSFWTRLSKMKPRATFFIAFIFSQLRLCAGAIDFCDADPRLEIRHSNCPDEGNPRLLLRLRNLDGNPYHALHDSLWPVAHYVARCTREFTRGSITFTVFGGALFNRSGCTADKPLPPRGPYWGYCAVHSLAARVGGEVVGDLANELPPGCFHKTVEFGVHKQVSKTMPGVGHTRDDFRGMSFFGRTCAGETNGQCDPNVANRSMLVPMPSRMKGNALKFLRESMMLLTEVSYPVEKTGRKIRVLLYDRNDTSRRQWVNSEPIHTHLLKDSKVDVRFVQKTPKSLSGQVQLYAWPDVVVGPHGAAMVNTIFMKEGTEIVEGRKLCDEHVGKDRFRPNDWTGWHAQVMNINVQYVQCHREEGPYKERHQLFDNQHGPPTNGKHKYRVEEVLELLETALERQVVRMRTIGRTDFWDSTGYQVKNIIHVHGNLRWASMASAWVFGPLCLTLFVFNAVVRTRKRALND